MGGMLAADVLGGFLGIDAADTIAALTSDALFGGAAAADAAAAGTGLAADTGLGTLAGSGVLDAGAAFGPTYDTAVGAGDAAALDGAAQGVTTNYQTGEQTTYNPDGTTTTNPYAPTTNQTPLSTKQNASGLSLSNVAGLLSLGAGAYGVGQMMTGGSGGSSNPSGGGLQPTIPTTTLNWNYQNTPHPTGSAMGQQYLNPVFTTKAEGGLTSLPETQHFSDGGLPTMVSNQAVMPTTMYDRGIPGFSGKDGSIVKQFADYFTQPSVNFPARDTAVNSYGSNAQYIPGQAHQESFVGLPGYMLQELGRKLGINKTPDPRQGMYIPNNANQNFEQKYGYNRPSDIATQIQDNSANAHGGIYSLGSYSDGGRLLKGPGDGMSDNIPATIGHKQPARLADGEFVIPADVVSHLGNGSTDAGSRVLYKMMDQVREDRTGNPKQGKQINPEKYMPV